MHRKQSSSQLHDGCFAHVCACERFTMKAAYIPDQDAARDALLLSRLIISSVQKPSCQSGSGATGCCAPSSSAIPLPTVSFPSVLITFAGTVWPPPCLLRGASVASAVAKGTPYMGHCSAFYMPGIKSGGTRLVLVSCECQHCMCQKQDSPCDQLVLPCSLPLYPHGRLHLWSAWTCPLHECGPVSFHSMTFKMHGLVLFTRVIALPAEPDI